MDLASDNSSILDLKKNGLEQRFILLLSVLRVNPGSRGFAESVFSFLFYYKKFTQLIFFTKDFLLGTRYPLFRTCNCSCLLFSTVSETIWLSFNYRTKRCSLQKIISLKQSVYIKSTKFMIKLYTVPVSLSGSGSYRKMMTGPSPCQSLTGICP
jgi:hypothetical protein